MTKPERTRSRDLIELVDEPDRPGASSVDAGTDGAVDLGTVDLVPLEVPPPDPESFEDFYRRELPRLLVLARALAGDLAAEDIAQESMLVAYRQWSRISRLRSPAGYVRGICSHHAVSSVRRRLSERRAVRRLATRSVTWAEPLANDGDRFWSEVRRLPQRQAQVVALFYALDLPVREVATTLGCAEGTVKMHLSRARSELATRLGTTEEES